MKGADVGKHDVRRGTRVVVTMARNDVFPWQSAPSFEATFEWAPGGPGDTYHVRLDDGRQVHINGNGSDFVAIHAATPSDQP